MKRSILLAIVSSLVLLSSISASQEAIFGLGVTDQPNAGSDNEVLSVEYVHKPFYEHDRFSAALASNFNITTDSDWFLGAGIAMRWHWDNGWFAEGSFMPGYSEAGLEGNDLGNDLVFRSALSVGYEFERGGRWSAAVTHTSNASLGDENPGVDKLLLRYHLPLHSSP